MKYEVTLCMRETFEFECESEEEASDLAFEYIAENGFDQSAESVELESVKEI